MRVFHLQVFKPLTILSTVFALTHYLWLSRLAYLTYIEKCWEDGRAIHMSLTLEHPANS